MKRRHLPLLAALAAIGCQPEAEPRAQWTVFVGTDAPLPAFGDRLRVQIVDDDGKVCGTCSRTFDALGELPLSFGVEPVENVDRPRLRMQLYRATATDSAGEPRPPFLELLAKLPALEGAPVTVAAELSMRCFGKQSDLGSESSCDPATGEMAADLTLAAGTASDLPIAGSFGGQADACPEDNGGMVCVPGGVFLLGSAVYVPFGEDFDPVPEQLVRVSTFLLDSEEMTVARMRELSEMGVPAPLARSDTAPYCNYSDQPGELDDYPVNCLRQVDAAAACEALGKRLPTEAEWEFAAGGGSLDAPFPWQLSDTSNAALCRTAALARIDLLADGGSRLCVLLEPGLEDGSQPVDSTRDESRLGIRNLGGNLAEWVADSHVQLSDSACWGPDVTLRDNPICLADSGEGVAKGGDYANVPYNSHSFFRRPVPSGGLYEFLGFRCAKDLP